MAKFFLGKNKTLNHTKEERITLNTITCEEEKYPIWEVASSHMARRVLVGNLYKEVKDPTSSPRSPATSRTPAPSAAPATSMRKWPNK